MRFDTRTRSIALLTALEIIILFIIRTRDHHLLGDVVLFVNLDHSVSEFTD
jgi:hypothetical protein